MKISRDTREIQVTETKKIPVVILELDEQEADALHYVAGRITNDMDNEKAVQIRCVLSDIYSTLDRFQKNRYDGLTYTNMHIGSVKRRF
jgi:hypothetical protein